MKKIAAWACLVIYLNAAAQSLLPCFGFTGDYDIYLVKTNAQGDTLNPANDFLQVSGLQATNEGMIVNVLGAVMPNIPVSPGEKINISQLPPGMYFLRTRTSHAGFGSRKFLIVR